MKRALIVIFLVLLADQALKVYMKTHFLLGESMPRWTPDGKVYLQLVENPGMAFGLVFGGETGKLALTLFRIVAAVVIGYVLWRLTRQRRDAWLVTSLALIFAGAVGNIIDSAFYGLLFDKGTIYNAAKDLNIGYTGLAAMDGSGYAPFLHGAVVDMFYFPLWHGRIPDWFPIWAGEPFEFFRPVFNIADASITVGVALMILGRRKQQPQPAAPPHNTAEVREAGPDPEVPVEITAPPNANAAEH